MTYTLEEPFGPNYNIDNATLRKFRRDKHADRKAYGAAVLAAVLASQATQLRRAAVALPRPACASNTALTTGRAILKAVANQQQSALENYPGQERRERDPETWRKMYKQAMIGPRKRAKLRVKRPSIKHYKPEPVTVAERRKATRKRKDHDEGKTRHPNRRILRRA